MRDPMDRFRHFRDAKGRPYPPGGVTSLGYRPRFGWLRRSLWRSVPHA